MASDQQKQKIILNYSCGADVASVEGPCVVTQVAEMLHD